MKQHDVNNNDGHETRIWTYLGLPCGLAHRIRMLIVVGLDAPSDDALDLEGYPEMSKRVEEQE